MQSRQCLYCQHFQLDNQCDAFPERIPDAIMTGLFDHRQPYPNADKPTDGGIRFQILEGYDEAEVFGPE